jgi:hypothetical protein
VRSLVQAIRLESHLFCRASSSPVAKVNPLQTILESEQDECLDLLTSEGVYYQLVGGDRVVSVMEQLHFSLQYPTYQDIPSTARARFEMTVDHHIRTNHPEARRRVTLSYLGEGGSDTVDHRTWSSMGSDGAPISIPAVSLAPALMKVPQYDLEPLYNLPGQFTLPTPKLDALMVTDELDGASVCFVALATSGGSTLRMAHVKPLGSSGSRLQSLLEEHGHISMSGGAALAKAHVFGPKQYWKDAGKSPVGSCCLFGMWSVAQRCWSLYAQVRRPGDVVEQVLKLWPCC